MRPLIRSLLPAVALAALLALAPARAEAQVFVRYGGYYAAPPVGYYQPAPYYVGPAYAYPRVGYYAPTYTSFNYYAPRWGYPRYSVGYSVGPVYPVYYPQPYGYYGRSYYYRFW